LERTPINHYGYSHHQELLESLKPNQFPNDQTARDVITEPPTLTKQAGRAKNNVIPFDQALWKCQKQEFLMTKSLTIIAVPLELPAKQSLKSNGKELMKESYLLLGFALEFVSIIYVHLEPTLSVKGQNVLTSTLLSDRGNVCRSTGVGQKTPEIFV